MMFCEGARVKISFPYHGTWNIADARVVGLPDGSDMYRVEIERPLEGSLLQGSFYRVYEHEIVIEQDTL